MADQRDPSFLSRSPTGEVTTAAASDLIADGAIILDVRESYEYEAAALPGAILIPVGDLADQAEYRLPRSDTPIVVYCATGVRSLFAINTLASMGYSGAVSMAGGIQRWKAEGRAIDDNPSAPSTSRYHRHHLLPEVGVEGQVRLQSSKVLLVGVGGLGSPAALYLAAAGIGTLGIVDKDTVDESNLQRQILYSTPKVGQRKVVSAATTLGDLNPDVEVRSYDTALNAANVSSIIEGYDLIIDGTDNFPTRYLLNDASVKAGIPVIHGSIHRCEGMVTVFDPRRGPTYRDMVPQPPSGELAPDCATAGVLGVLPGVIGTLQATEAIKILIGIGRPLIGRLLTFDALEMEFSEFTLEIDPANEVTWANRDRIELVDLTGTCRASLNR